jgi:hypothetical protein
MKFENNPQKHEKIGVGGYKRAYKIYNEGRPEVQLVMKYEYTDLQMKGLFYLNKIATAIFPGKIASVMQAGNIHNEDSVVSQFRSEYYEPDEQHRDMQSVAKLIDGNYEFQSDDPLHQEFSSMWGKRACGLRSNPDVQKFVDAYEEAGFLAQDAALPISWGPQDIIFSQDGSFVYVDVDVPWDEPEEVGEDSYTARCLHFDPVKLQKTIHALPEETRREVQTHFDRLIALCQEAGFQI